MESLVAACFACPWWDENSWWLTALVAVSLGLVAYCLRYQLLIRLPLWLLQHTVYRVKVQGLENIPATGAALLVCNHVSHIDAGLVLAAQKRRIRFLIWAPHMTLPGLRWLLRLGRVIPIDGTAGPRAIIQSLRTASEALAQGELVCIFAEGGITRTGFLLPFQRGFEQIVKRCPAPIIPVCLDHVWGSIFSYERGRFFWKWPKRIPYTVHVTFGAALPATANAFEVRQAIQKLSADSACRRHQERVLVHRQFLRQALRHPFRSCLIDVNRKDKPILRYWEALAGAKILLRLLKPLLGDDPMVGLWIPPSAGGAIVNITLAFLRKTAVNLNYSAAPEVVQSAIRQCGIRRVLASKLFCLKVPLEVGPEVEVIYLEDFRKKISKWDRLRAAASVFCWPLFLQERFLGLQRHRVDDLLTVIFSSGTTGEPKGVMLTHGNIAANTESMVQAINLGPQDRLLGILPFFHSFGYAVTLWVPLQVGASAVYFPNPLQAREIGELCRTFRCTVFLSTPTFLRSFIRRCEPGDFASLRLLWCGAEKMPQSLADEFHQKFGLRPLEGYGCTELSPAASANVPDWQQDNMRQVGNKPGTIGRPLPGVAVRIVHKETGQDLPPNEEGLLLVYGANVMKGYLGKEELTKRKIIQDGWYVTGDLAKIDEEGFITITGREERFAKIGGEMVPLELVEEELHNILNTSDRCCAVTAIPDIRKGERIIVLHLPLADMTSGQLWSRLNSRGLPNLYIPSQRDFFQVQELPILGSGKLDLKKCRQQALELAGTNGEP